MTKVQTIATIEVACLARTRCDSEEGWRLQVKERVDMRLRSRNIPHR